MSAFAASSYASDAYKAFRPSYSGSLLDLVLAYHKGGRNVAIDIGCGTGQATVPLTKKFAHVIGADPSANMVSTANAGIASSGHGPGSLIYVAGSDTDWSQVGAELAKLGTKDAPAKVDFIMGAQTGHWWNIPAFLAAAKPYCAPKATIALVGYTLVHSRTHPKITTLLNNTAYGDDRLGPFWEPGRHELENGYPNIFKALQEGGVQNLSKIEFLGKTIERTEPSGSFGTDPKAFIELDMNLAALKNYLGTWSSYNTWKKEHPKLVDTEEDPRAKLIDAVRAELGEEGKDDAQIKVELDWPHFLICGEL